MDIKYSFTKREYINSKVEYIFGSEDFKKRFFIGRYILTIVIFVPFIFLGLKEGIFTFLILYIVSTTLDPILTRKILSYGLEDEVNEFLLSINEAGLSIIATNYDIILYWSLLDKIVESGKYLHIYNSKEIISIPKNSI